MSSRKYRLLVCSLLAGVVFMGGCKVDVKGDFGHMTELMESALDNNFQEWKQYQNENLMLIANGDHGNNKVISKPWQNNGFWAGNLWLMYELTGDEKWKDRALQFTLPPEGEQWNEEYVLLGAKMMASFGQAIKSNDSKYHRDVLVQSAKVLSSRFNAGIGAMGELMTDSATTFFSVNIINLLNIDLLFWAAKETGNENFSKVAIMHVQTILNNHFNVNNSCSEIVDYDLKTGSIIRTYNRNAGFHQSSWNLGQAVALYGVTAAYRETNRFEFLRHAEQIAGFILSQPQISFNRLPVYESAELEEFGLADDFSFGVIVASALYELSTYSANADDYIKTADEIMQSISSKMFPVAADNKLNIGSGFLSHAASLGKATKTMYPGFLTDYYFLESLVNRRASIR